MNDPAHAAVATFAASDYAFSSPELVPAGLTTVEIINQGRDLHHAQLIRLAPGKNIEDFKQVLKTNSQVPEWAVLIGGPNAVIPGERAAAIVNLDPGTYVVVCWIPDPNNTTQVALGMILLFQVRRKADASELPIGDVRIGELDFSFVAPDRIEPGRHVVRAQNYGEPHEVLLVQLPPNGSIADVGSAVADGVATQPAGEACRRRHAVAAGVRGSFLGGLYTRKIRAYLLLSR